MFSYRSQKMPIYGKKTTEPLDCALCANLFAQQTQFLASGCSVFSWPPSLILMAEEGWGEKEICTRGVINGQKIRRGAHSNSKSNMASRVNDRQLITLARPNKTPALQDRFLTTSFSVNCSLLLNRSKLTWRLCVYERLHLS